MAIITEVEVNHDKLIHGVGYKIVETSYIIKKTFYAMFDSYVEEDGIKFSSWNKTILILEMFHPYHKTVHHYEDMILPIEYLYERHFYEC